MVIMKLCLINLRAEVFYYRNKAANEEMLRKTG